MQSYLSIQYGSVASQCDSYLECMGFQVDMGLAF